MSRCTLTRKQVNDIRSYALTSGMNPTEIKETLKLELAVSNIYRIVYNKTYRDPDYTPPEHVGFRAGKMVRRFTQTFICSKCGVEKPDDQYYRKKNTGKPYRIHACKACYCSLNNHRKYNPDVPRAYVTQPKQPCRLASIDCKFTCPTCGGAYPERGGEPFQTMREALQCCRNVELDAEEA